ncbi:hypothetical protein Lesp02_70440 [Lentzea sp. NBRC 105346]|uniref:hypothetical protein n=1 Tax=Lentzea sp. NBRC 105346 TaxID=3032205 RepID=UPI0024A1D7C7|nr:hypothetical protein [Lentzea sp. NBRC 105346]GLZ34857.1 hypothetical protein Lesp02_70440 [Lentzea sp. NBRC 105346]
MSQDLKRAREMSQAVVDEATADMPAQHPSQRLADEMATGFRALAKLFEVNPALAELARYSSFDRIMVCLGSSDEPVTAMADFVRAAKAHGAKISKSGNEKWFNVDLTFGCVGLHVYAARDEVCERVVVGTREVVEEVPDPEALAAVPTTTVTRTEEIVEWQCKPLLAGGAVTK